MHYSEESFYHIYNRGNNKETIFFQDRNYSYFLDKVKKYILPNCDLLAWCLMPNHFHLLIQANAASVKIVKQTPIEINALTESIRLLLSSYAQGIQKQENLKGGLFQQKTKSKCADDYLVSVFHYIHQNPLRANLVSRMEDYPWSSFGEYLSTREGMCNTEAAYKFIGLNKERFLKDAYAVIPDDVLKLLE